MYVHPNSSLQKTPTPYGVEMVAIKVRDEHISDLMELHMMGSHAFFGLLHRKTSINHDPVVMKSQETAISR
jgi:hypothetical protein